MIKLYDFQKDCVEQLLDGKHIIVSGTGCLSAGTPVPMANGNFKPVEALSAGDKIFSYDEYLDKIIENEVAQVIRTCHNPKPMIELEYDGEKITTTYDHPFFNGDGYYPLYQLIWGALETSQRVQLKLLCEQYGQAFNDKVEKCKHCESNEPCEGRKWVLQDGDGWENNKSPQGSGRELVGQSEQIGMCEPYQLQQSRQQSRQSGMVFKKIQRLVGNKTEDNEKTKEQKQQENTNGSRKSIYKGILYQKYTTKKEQQGEEAGIRQTPTDVSEFSQRDIRNMGVWKIKVKVSEPYYTISMRKAPYTYFIGQKHCFMTHNSGKTFMMFDYLRRQDPDKILVVALPSKIVSKDFERDAENLCGASWAKKRTVEYVSWYKLHDWVYKKHQADLGDWVVAADEIHFCTSGISSKRGRAFLNLAKHCKRWVGFTATPGDTWIKFYPYFTASNLIKHKTEFMRRFCIQQTYPFPMIKGYLHEDELSEMWKSISYAPDTSEVFAQLPKKTYNLVRLKKPRGYDRVIKTSTTPDGTLLESNMALAHYARGMCSTKQKQEWLSDWLDSTDESAVIFYNYTAEREAIIEMAKKKKRKVWRIDGQKHEIPTKDTIKKGDLVVAHYQSGGASLNLQFLRYWISYSYNYSYTTFLQALGRIDRIGQERPMTFWFLRCENTIEDDIAKALSNKRDFAEAEWAP